VGETRLLDRRDVDEHVLAAVIANDEAKSLLWFEEFDDAFAFADDLGRHPAAGTAASAAESSSAGATAAKATASAAAGAAGALTKAASAAAAAVSTAAAALLKSAALFGESLSAEEIVTLIAAAPAAVAFAPSVETHACPNFRVPTTI